MTLHLVVVKYSNNEPIAREGDVLERRENMSLQWWQDSHLLGVGVTVRSGVALEADWSTDLHITG